MQCSSLLSHRGEVKGNITLALSAIGFQNYICVFIHVHAFSSVLCECLYMLSTSSFTLEEGIGPLWD